MRITCKKYPTLLITSPHVEFVDGVAEVTEDVARIVAPLAEAFSIELGKAPEAPSEPPTAPDDGEDEGTGEEGAGKAPEAPEKPRRGPGRPPKNG